MTKLRATLALASVAAALALLTGQPATAAAPSLGRLQSELGQQAARGQSLAAGLSSLHATIAGLTAQVALVRTREAAVEQELAADRAQLGRTRARLAAARRELARLRLRLAAARSVLARQLVAGYESSRPDLVSVLLSAHGFTDLLDQLHFLGLAQQQQQTIITITRRARAGVQAAARQLAGLTAQQQRATADATIHVRALAGMNELLSAKQSALGRAEAAQRAALAAVRARSGRLRGQIAQVRARLAAQAAAAAAARRAAEQAANQTAGAGGAGAGGAGAGAGADGAGGVGTGAVPSGGWAIPAPIVLCESGGQNLPPNSAGASGYYQITPATWKLFGGSGPAAYLASKAEQDAVASRIWRGGAGASNWTCAGIVGIG